MARHDAMDNRKIDRPVPMNNDIAEPGHVAHHRVLACGNPLVSRQEIK